MVCSGPSPRTQRSRRGRLAARSTERRGAHDRLHGTRGGRPTRSGRSSTRLQSGRRAVDDDAQDDLGAGSPSSVVVSTRPSPLRRSQSLPWRWAVWLPWRAEENYRSAPRRNRRILCARSTGDGDSSVRSAAASVTAASSTSSDAMPGDMATASADATVASSTSVPGYVTTNSPQNVHKIGKQLAALGCTDISACHRAQSLLLRAHDAVPRTARRAVRRRAAVPLVFDHEIDEATCSLFGAPPDWALLDGWPHRRCRARRARGPTSPERRRRRGRSTRTAAAPRARAATRASTRSSSSTARAPPSPPRCRACSTSAATRPPTSRCTSSCRRCASAPASSC